MDSALPPSPASKNTEGDRINASARMAINALGFLRWRPSRAEQQKPTNREGDNVLDCVVGGTLQAGWRPRSGGGRRPLICLTPPPSDVAQGCGLSMMERGSCRAVQSLLSVV